jgi:hypothetical protein
MDTFSLLLITGFLIWLLSLAQRAKKWIGIESIRKPGRATNFLPPIPKGFQIFEGRLPVAGISYRKGAASAFANSDNHCLRFEREPSNVHDPNAIKIIGIAQAGEFFIGYVPKEIAEQIAVTNLFDFIQPRLARIYIGHDGFIDILYQLIGPKSKKSEFDAFRKQLS